MFTDHHCHTHISPDSDETVLQHAAAAHLRGLDGFIVTDHVDMPDWIEFPGYVYNPRRDDGYAEVLAARERYPDLYIGFGAELGNELYDIERARPILADPRLDFVIGSAHTRADGYDFAVLPYLSLDDCYNTLERYCVGLLTHCQSANFDVLGHLTYPLNYMAKAGFRPDLTRYRDAVAECLKALISRGKGIECNSSGLRRHLGETMPGAYWFRLFRDLGGEIVTLGSDAHTAQDLGADFTVAAEMLKECGFTRYAVFKSRKPEFINL